MIVNLAYAVVYKPRYLLRQAHKVKPEAEAWRSDLR